MERQAGGAGTSGSCQGVQGDGVPLPPERRSRERKRAMFARSADELTRPHGF